MAVRPAMVNISVAIVKRKLATKTVVYVTTVAMALREMLGS